MTYLNKLANRSTIGSIDFVIPRIGEKARLIAGLGINVIGAGVLLAYGIRLLGF